MFIGLRKNVLSLIIAYLDKTCEQRTERERESFVNAYGSKKEI